MSYYSRNLDRLGMMPQRHSFDDPKRIPRNISILFAIYVLIIVLISVSLAGPWYHQEWKIANGSALKWTLSLHSAEFFVNCTSANPEFLNFCSSVFGVLGGDLDSVRDNLCTSWGALEDTDLQALVQETCKEFDDHRNRSIATVFFCGFGLACVILSMVALLVNCQFTYNSKRAYYVSFIMLFVAWISCVTGSIIYGAQANEIKRLFFYAVTSDAPFHPAASYPLRGSMTYGFECMIATCVIFGPFLYFWRKLVPEPNWEWY